MYRGCALDAVVIGVVGLPVVELGALASLGEHVRRERLRHLPIRGRG